MNQFSHTQKSIATTPTGSSAQADTNHTVMASLIIVLPLLVVFAVLGHRKYRTVRRQQRIKRLEKIWQLSHEEKKS